MNVSVSQGLAPPTLQTINKVKCVKVNIDQHWTIPHYNMADVIKPHSANKIQLLWESFFQDCNFKMMITPAIRREMQKLCKRFQQDDDIMKISEIWYYLTTQFQNLFNTSFFYQLFSEQDKSNADTFLCNSFSPGVKSFNEKQFSYSTSTLKCQT